MLEVMNTTFIESFPTGPGATQRYGYDFIPPAYLPPGEDEYYLRNQQLEALYTPPGSPLPQPRRQDLYRPLKSEEIRILEAQGNSCAAWQDLRVKDGFNPHLVKHCVFTGFVRIGSLDPGFLRYHDYMLPVGITHSRIIACDIGDRPAIHDCRYLSHYLIGDGVILSSIDEMDTTNHAKFGEGILKDGEEEDVRVWIDPLNEAGGRSVLPFLSMICADAYLWAVYREDTRLMDAFKGITQGSVDSRRGYYGTIGHGTVIKHCHTIKDARIGAGAYIKGAHKLKNISIQSDPCDPTQIGEGVELVNGIIGYGCRVFYGCKAVRFVLGNNCNLKYGARLIHSILGDNSTISCCEVLNTLVFPAHEQHHNNSFLIAAMILGQSNMAAGATVGSNHNSRGNDGEIIAGRGFWPGLSSTLKHNSRFASYTLIAKGNYPAELHIPLPFSLITNNSATTQLEVMPGYWWLYNMYALERNSWKCRIRDKRHFPVQHIETAYLAPDTVAEIIRALTLMEGWVREAGYQSLRDLPPQAPVWVAKRTLERSNQPVRIIKARQGLKAYREMLLYYGVKTLVDFFSLPQGDRGYGDFLGLQSAHPEAVPLDWVNLGGQLVMEPKVDALRAAIREGECASWDQIHRAYDRFLLEYPVDKALNALQVLRFLQSGNPAATASETSITKEHWNNLLDEGLRIRGYIEEQVYKTKLKDYLDPFRQSTYRNKAEQDAVLGHIDANLFVQEVRAESRIFLARVEAARL
jgi:NDP-sugar pyrophosphorylase family protein